MEAPKGESVTKTEEAKRQITALLSRGPLYEGALAGLVGGSRWAFDRALQELRQAGTIKRDLPENPQTWRLA